jgi:nucleoside phosphorylase
MATLVVAAAREELGEMDGEAVGVGPIVAAARAAAIVSRLRPSRVVLIGTAGAYRDGPPVGAAVAGSRIGWASGVAALGLGYVPRAPAPIACELDPRLRCEWHPILTVGAVTTDSGLAGRFATAGWSVEHLEAYAVALACAEAGIPFLAVLGIANEVGPDAHVQWLANRDSAQDAARRAIAPLL